MKEESAANDDDEKLAQRSEAGVSLPVLQLLESDVDSDENAITFSNNDCDLKPLHQQEQKQQEAGKPQSEEKDNHMMNSHYSELESTTGKNLKPITVAVGMAAKDTPTTTTAAVELIKEAQQKALLQAENIGGVGVEGGGGSPQPTAPDEQLAPRLLRNSGGTHTRRTWYSSFPGAYHIGRPEEPPIDDIGSSSDEDDDNSTSGVADDAMMNPENQQQIVLEATLAEEESDAANNDGRATSDQQEPGHNPGPNYSQQPTSSTSTTPVLRQHGELVEGTVCNEDDESKMMSHTEFRFSILALLVMILTIVFLALGLSGVFQNKKSDDNNNEATSSTSIATITTLAPSTTPSTKNNITIAPNDTILTNKSNWSPTLERIQKSGVLNCGYTKGTMPPYLLSQDENGTVTGFVGDLYNAIAAAANARVQLVHADRGQLRACLLRKECDVLVRTFVHTFASEVHQVDHGAGFSHSRPYAYTGESIGGDPHYVKCVDDGFRHLGECSGLRVCINEGRPEQAEWMRLLPIRNLVLRNGTSLTGLADGSCNVLNLHNFFLSETNIRKTGYSGNYTKGTTLMGLEGTTAVMRSTDPVFSDFVSAVLHSLFVAEKYNITQSTAASRFPQTNVFGKDYKDMFPNAISAVGTFGEIRFRNLGSPTRPLVNQINNGSTGLMLPPKLGFVNNERSESERPLGPIITKIIDSGTLRCGIITNRTGFAVVTEDGISSYSGMDVDYCHALAASLFLGDSNNVTFVELESKHDGFLRLAANQIDVMAGVPLTLENDVREPTTGLGFGFSEPYFYGYSAQEDTFCLVSRQEDHDWSSFVNWVHMATLYAEQNNITRATSNQMPEVFVYGRTLKRMFRDIILTVGNYGEIYSRNVESTMPRGGRNMLNINPHLGPQHYIIPGYVR